MAQYRKKYLVEVLFLIYQQFVYLHGVLSRKKRKSAPSRNLKSTLLPNALQTSNVSFPLVLSTKDLGRETIPCLIYSLRKEE